MNKPTSSASSAGDRPLLNPVDWAVKAGVGEAVMLGAQRRVRRRRRQCYLAVGGAVAALALGALGWDYFPGDAKSLEAAMAPTTAVSVPARQMLPDGSAVELKEGAEIAVTYSPTTRRVELVRGEAHFLVVKDTARPFIVAANGVEVRAVGTSFAVERRDGQVEVLVTTGRVAIDRVVPAVVQEIAPKTIATLEAGTRTLVEVTSTQAAPVVEALSMLEMGNRLAWRVPRLEFTRTPLAEAVRMINQHSALKLVLADEELASVQISGRLRVDNVESLFHLLKVEHRIKAERRGASEILLSAGR